VRIEIPATPHLKILKISQRGAGSEENGAIRRVGIEALEGSVFSTKYVVHQ